VSAPDEAAALQALLAGLPAAVRAEVTAALGGIGADMVEGARTSLAQGSPSAPGKPPADPGGSLAASLHWSLDEANGQVTVGTSDPAAIFLEYGTRKMAARPFLRPAASAVTEKAQARLRSALVRACARVFGGPS
jgi:HK97 gp10 family phage protein